MGAVRVGRSRVAIVVALALVGLGPVFAAPAARAAHAQATPAAHAAQAHAAQAHAMRVTPIAGQRLHKTKRRVLWPTAGAGLGQLDEMRRNGSRGELRGEGEGADRVQVRRYDAPANAPPGPELT